MRHLLIGPERPHSLKIHQTVSDSLLLLLDKYGPGPEGKPCFYLYSIFVDNRSLLNIEVEIVSDIFSKRGIIMHLLVQNLKP